METDDKDILVGADFAIFAVSVKHHVLKQISHPE